MMLGSRFFAGAFWGARAETPEELAGRWLKLIARLQAIDPIFAHWYTWVGVRRVLLFDTEAALLSKKIAAGVIKGDFREPLPMLGYQFSVYNNTASEGGSWPRNFEINMHAGSSADYPLNKISISTDCDAVPDPDVVTYSVFKEALLALAETFDAAMAVAYPSRVKDFWPQFWEPRQGLPLAWISYIAPQFASLIAPPAQAIVEQRPDGGLLMAATDETFDATNPKHLAVAREIEAAVAPFNALPYPWNR